MTAPIDGRVSAAGLVTCLTMALAFGASGCGGSGPTDSVVVTEPGSKVPYAGAGGTTAAPASGSPTNAAPVAPSAGKEAGSSSAAPAAKSEGWGTLKGQVVFGGDPPAQKIEIEQGKAPKDPEVCAKNSPIKAERFVVDGATKGVKNVLVYLTKVSPASIHPDAKAAASKATVEFDQKGCVFEPHVLGVMAGAKIDLKSSDPVSHNVNAAMRANAPFNSVLAAGNELPYSPPSAERQPVPVTCNIHPWMQAYWLVLDHPYFAVTDAKGNFEIKNAPAGTQRVVVWQEATGFVTASQGDEVTIQPNGDTPKSFTINPAQVKK